MITIYLALAVFLADVVDSSVVDSTVVGKLLVRTASTNGIHLRAYVADVILPRRTDALVVELNADPNSRATALWHSRERTFFLLEFLDSAGKPVRRTSEGERRLLDLPRKSLESDSERPAPILSPSGAFTQRFNLSELYILHEGETYTLSVHTKVQTNGGPYKGLRLTIPIKVGEIPL